MKEPQVKYWPENFNKRFRVIKRGDSGLVIVYDGAIVARFSEGTTDTLKSELTEILNEHYKLLDSRIKQ